MARRLRAASRSVPLDCGCRDTLPCKCSVPPISPRALDSWRDAANHVLATTDKTPAVPIDVCRALWRRGGEDRQLVETLIERAPEWFEVA